MKYLLLKRFIVIGLVLFSTPIVADTREKHDWYSVMLDGKKLGYTHSVRSVDKKMVTTKQTMILEISRLGTTMSIAVIDQATETKDGIPLSFYSEQSLSDNAVIIKGERLESGQWMLTTKSLGFESTDTFTWPDNAVLFEGLRLLSIKKGLSEGAHYSVLTYSPQLKQAIEVDITIGKVQQHDLFGRLMELIEIDQKMIINGISMVMTSYVDREYNLIKTKVPMMGMELELIQCAKSCALAKSEPVDFFTELMPQAPRVVSFQERQGALRYVLKGDGSDLKLPVSSEQKIEYGESGIVSVTVSTALNEHDSDAQSQARWLKSSPWVQSDDELIQQLAQQVTVESVKYDRDIAIAIEQFVRSYIEQKSLSVGFASALEVAKSKSGDCTEHAVLAIALARALGLPARMASGMAYADGYAGKQQVFVPHAWAQIFQNGHWRSIDAALNGFDSGHIAFSYGGAQDSEFLNGANILGTLQVLNIIQEE